MMTRLIVLLDSAPCALPPAAIAAHYQLHLLLLPHWLRCQKQAAPIGSKRYCESPTLDLRLLPCSPQSPTTELESPAGGYFPLIGKSCAELAVEGHHRLKARCTLVGRGRGHSWHW